MYKRDIINFLFVLSFPMYGIGTYFSATTSPSAGYVISMAPHLLIILFYFIDILYKREFNIRLNAYYVFMLFFILSSIASLFIALSKELPESSLVITTTKSLLLIVPFHSFLIIGLYNDQKQSLVQLTLISLSLLLVLNLIGYFGLGLSNGLHSIEGRLSFPFIDGFYSGASLLAIINLMLLYYLQRPKANPIRFLSLGAFFTLNLGMFFLINSRLAILVFVLVLALCFFGIVRMKGIYLLSMFTIPILLGCGPLIYKILQLPGLSSLLQRVDAADVMTFNGRAFLWKDGVDWLLYDQRGLFLGNGFRGHYFLDLISNVAKLWNEKNVHHLHFHSTSMEILVSQGIVFFTIFAALFYYSYRYFKKKHQMKKEEGAFFPVILYLLFILQVDTFLYLDGLGFVIFSLIVSRVAINKESARLNTERSEFHYLKASQEWRGAIP